MSAQPNIPVRFVTIFSFSAALVGLENLLKAPGHLGRPAAINYSVVVQGTRQLCDWLVGYLQQGLDESVLTLIHADLRMSFT